MRRNALRSVIGLCGLVAVVALTVPVAGQPPQPNAELTRILNLMEQRQKQAGIVRVKAQGTRFTPKGAASEMSSPRERTDKTVVPAQDENIELRHDIIFDFGGQRYRRQYSEKLGSKFDSWISVNDGKKRYGAKPDLPIEQLDAFQPSDMSVVSGAGKANILNWNWWPYLISQGFVITNHRQPYYMSEFAIPLDKENLFVHGNGVADGVSCLILRTFPHGPKGQEGFYEYIIGRDDGTIRRLTNWMKGGKDIEIAISYRKTGERLAPASWVIQAYQSHGANRLYQSETMKVTAFDAGDALADRFSLTPASGATIRERQYADDVRVIRARDETVVHYTVDESARWIEGDVVDGQFKPHQFLWWWIGGGLLVVLLGVLVWRLVRRRSSATSANSESGGAT